MVMIRQEDVTIIIPTLQHSEEQSFAFKHCLQSLLETCDCNIIIALNGVSEVTQITNYKNSVERVKFMVLEQQGQCQAVNAAAATVSTPWIMVTNDDMMYAPGWFGKLVEPVDMLFIDNKKIDVEELESKPHARVLVNDVASVFRQHTLCISPQLIEPIDGAPTFKKFFAGGAGGDFNKQAWLDYAETHQGDGLRTGFNLPFLIRKDVWDLVGGYDVNYDPWGSNSDSDLEYKLKLVGIQPMQNTNCPVYHFSQTSGTFEPRNRPSWEKNWQYFIDKWGFPRTDDGIWQATFTTPGKEEGRKFQPWWEGFYAK